MTPAVMSNPRGSASFPPSTEKTDSRFEWREVHDAPFRFGALWLSSPPPLPSYRLSVCLSLCNFRPKNDDFPAEDCLDCFSFCVDDGIVVLPWADSAHG